MTIAEANEPFASGLKTVIAEKGLKNNRVAANAGFTAQELSDMINGRRILKICDAFKLANVLETTLDDVIKKGLERG